MYEIITLLKSGSGFIVILFALLSIFIEIAPVKLNPLSSFVQWIGNAFNKDLKQAMKIILLSELNTKYKSYLTSGYVPDDEFEEYIEMHDVYNALGGNHTGDEKFNYIMKNLERKIDKTEQL